MVYRGDDGLTSDCETETWQKKNFKISENQNHLNLKSIPFDRNTKRWKYVPRKLSHKYISLESGWWTKSMQTVLNSELLIWKAHKKVG